MTPSCPNWPSCGCGGDCDFARCSKDAPPWGALAAVAVVALIVALGLAWLFLATTQARAHEADSGMRYDSWCCNGNRHTGDCEAIPNHSVMPVPGGYRITLRPGDHHLVTSPQVFEKSEAETRQSTDGRFHACLFPDQTTLRCFYAPPMGM